MTTTSCNSQCDNNNMCRECCSNEDCYSDCFESESEFETSSQGQSFTPKTGETTKHFIRSVMSRAPLIPSPHFNALTHRY